MWLGQYKIGNVQQSLFHEMSKNRMDEMYPEGPLLDGEVI